MAWQKSINSWNSISIKLEHFFVFILLYYKYIKQFRLGFCQFDLAGIHSKITVFHPTSNQVKFLNTHNITKKFANKN